MVKIEEYKLKLSKHLNEEDIEKVYEFSKRALQEFGDFIKAIGIFGSTTRKEENNDIDILIIIDDVKYKIDREMVKSYRYLVDKIVLSIDQKLHITTFRLTSFWEYLRQGDPIAINILRDLVPLLDPGILEPMQLLLKQGRIRPTEEAVWAYYLRAPMSMNNAKSHILAAVNDLYWACIDSAHAALMKLGYVPPAPKHVKDYLNQIKKQGMIEDKYVKYYEEIFEIMKKITTGKMEYIQGKEFDVLLERTREFVERMKKIIEDQK